jgi:phage protein D
VDYALAASGGHFLNKRIEKNNQQFKKQNKTKIVIREPTASSSSGDLWLFVF